MKKYIFLFIILSLIYGVSKAQFSDDFSDGDFTQNPIWQGETTSFEVNSQNFLRLKSAGTDTAYLYTNSSIINNSEWRFFVKHSFNSSSNNLSRVYLASNQSNLEGNLNGYYVRIGGTQDNISLWRQDGNVHTEIISGSNISTGNSTNKINVKVVCNAASQWELWAYDIQNGAGLVLEGTVVDNTYSVSSYFGVYCKFTSSNATKFYFDDFYAGNIVVDTVAPKIMNINVVSDTEIDLKFDEVVEKNSAEDESNFNINNGIGNVAMALRDVTDSTIVHLILSNSLAYKQVYELEISDIEDAAGNIALDKVYNIVWYEIVHGDIVINEIMCDPSPSVSLPDAEYIELYNNSPKEVDLKNWSLTIGNSEKTFSAGKIDANSYAIIGHIDDEPILSSYGNFIGLSSFSLPNSSGRILLKDTSGSIIHYINYSLSWYNDNAKDDGGWSIEQVDASNICGQSNNWSASKDLRGGTPGEKNSIARLNPDTKRPNIVKLTVESDKLLRVFFDEGTDSVSTMDLLKYNVNKGIGAAISIIASYPDYKSYLLEFSNQFQLGEIYELEIDTGIEDCVGNATTEKSIIEFGLPQNADSNDVQINEVLFHPKNDGVDYVEIYNKSDKIIDVKNLRLANWSMEDENWANVKDIAVDGFLLFPHSYYIITTSKSMVKSQYYVEEPDNIIEAESMPSMANTEGNIYLISKNLQMIDGMKYTDDMHYSLLNNPEGISLERLSSTVSSMEAGNWFSAATPGRNAEGFGGTPTYINSQKASASNGGQWNVSPEIFSPDNDGRDDLLQINYEFGEAGYTAKINIYDSKGRLIRKLPSSQILGSKGFIVWDGLNDNNQKASIGIYVIIIEFYNPNGDAQQKKLTCVLGGKLD